MKIKSIIKLLVLIFMFAGIVAPLAFILSVIFSIGTIGFWEAIGVMIISSIMVLYLDEVAK